MSPSLSAVEQTRIGVPSAAPVRQTKSPTIMATRYVDIFGVVANFSVCLPASGPGSSDSTAPFEMAVSAASTMSETSNVALNRGSSNDGNARRASVASIWVTAYFRPFARLR